MAFCLLGLAVSGAITLDDSQCETKTFPDFHTEMRGLFPWYVLPAGGGRLADGGDR
ncbi:hypothetical protein AB0I98_45955 [Streptomyces sp. NPDC050211]|uniref:hypothetical protein n=1 Tax=Streptomyces sp. NPDC050211 TaxID=3154932 RepID=UPI0034290B6B